MGEHYYHQIGTGSQCKVEGKAVAELVWHYPLLDQVAFDWVQKAAASEHTLCQVRMSRLKSNMYQ